jgi:phage gp29-like protein
LNEVLHPGEKKVLQFVKDECTAIPEELEEQVEGILQSAAVGDKKILDQLDALINGLDQLLIAQGFDPEQTLFL